MNDQVAHTGLIRPFGPARPDQKCRGNSGELPIDKQADQITGKNSRDGAAGVNDPGNVLYVVPHVECVEHAKKGGNVENNADQLLDELLVGAAGGAA